MKDLNKSFIKNCAIVLAWCVPFIILLPIFWNFIYYYFNGEARYTLVQYATFVGGVAGPMAALAGFLFVYLSFEGQQQQFKRTKADEMFFKLFDLYKESREKITFKNGKKPPGDPAFKEILEATKYWAEHRWVNVYNTPELKEKFTRNSGYQLTEIPSDFNLKKIPKDTFKMLLDVNDNEQYYGLYKRCFKLLIEHCYKNGLGEYLALIETSMGKHERNYQYYHCYTRLEKDLEEFLFNNDFLKSINPKHLEDTGFGVLFWVDKN